MSSLTYRSGYSQLRGWRYFWAKEVTGYDLSTHCARCLKGPYLKETGLTMPVNQRIELPHAPGTILYFCGVSAPHRWVNNLHLAVRLTDDPADLAAVHGYVGGDMLCLDGAEQIRFDDAAARRMFTKHGPDFLTCRNFQFAAQMSCELDGKDG